MLFNKDKEIDILQSIILIGLTIFVIAIPHSIAIAQIGYTVGFLALIIKKLLSCESVFTKPSINWPIIGFILLTILSTIFSLDRSTSISKLRALTLLGVVYLIIEGIPKQIAKRTISFLVSLMIISVLIGVGWSFIEKIKGRGMTVITISPSSPLINSGLLAGDILWVIGRERVKSLDDINRVIQKSPIGKTLVFDALHVGDPLPIKLIVTEKLKNDPSTLGITVGGASSQFRVSGFTRHFGTYADQLLLFALFCLGYFISGFQTTIVHRQWYYGLAFIIISSCIVLTASRAVIIALVMTMAGLMMLMLNKRIVAFVLPLLLVTAFFGYFTVTSVRTASTGHFSDDSATRRISYMEAGMRIIPKYPMLGIGMDSQNTFWKELGFPGDHITHAHSTPIQIALDRGLPALACYVWMIVAMLISLRRGYKSNRQDRLVSGLNLGAFAAISGFTLSSLVNYNFGDSEVVMVALALFAFASTLHKEQSPLKSQDSMNV